MPEKTIEKLTNLEVSVNKNLFSITTELTMVLMVTLITEFFSRGEFPSVQGLTLFYIGILFLYSFHKEALRWLQKKGEERQGERFVYTWIILTIILYTVNFISHCKYSYSDDGYSLNTLNDIAITALEVLAIFVITRVSKLLKISFIKKHSSD